jgi:hypothetical protein
MNEYLKLAAIAFILILMFACFKRQRRYWTEMLTSKPTGSLKAGYKLAIATIFVALPLAAYSNTTEGWELFTSVLLMTVVFCVKITFSPAVIAAVLGVCACQLYAYDRFPFFEIWGAALSVFAWKLPEEARALYTSLTFVWALVILIGGGSSATEAATTADVADLTTLLPE